MIRCAAMWYCITSRRRCSRAFPSSVRRCRRSRHWATTGHFPLSITKGIWTGWSESVTRKNQKKPAGNYQTTEPAIYWDRCNASGKQVSSDLYFCQLQASTILSASARTPAIGFSVDMPLTLASAHAITIAFIYFVGSYDNCDVRYYFAD